MTWTSSDFEQLAFRTKLNKSQMALSIRQRISLFLNFRSSNFEPFNILIAMSTGPGIVEYYGSAGVAHKCGYCKQMRPDNADHGTFKHGIYFRAIDLFSFVS